MTTGAPASDAEGREPGSDEPSGFVGRGGWHLVAFIAALALILALSLDWYTTEQGEEFRRVEQNSQSGRQIEPDLDERAAQAAENEEKTAWQADALVDRLILLACLIAFVGAVAAAFMRSAGRRPQPPWHPSAIATVAGVAATLLILYRMIQPPGINDQAVIEIGAPLGLVAVGVLTIASRLAVLGERDELAGDGDAAIAAGAPEDEGMPQAASAPEVQGAPEAESGGESLLSRWTRRGGRGAKAAPAADAPAAEADPSEAAAFEFDFPSAPPPDADQREPEGQQVEEPEPVAEPEPVEEAVEEQVADEPAVEEPAPETEAPAPEAEAPAPEPVPDRILEDPVEAEPEPLEADPVEEAPLEEEPLDEELLDEEPLDEPLEDEPVEQPPVVEPEPVEEPVVEPPPIDEPAVGEPPVETDEEPLPLGEEIEFEYGPESPTEEDEAPPDPASRADDPDDPDAPGSA